MPTTTKRKRSAPVVKGDLRSETLAKFSRKVDQHTGRAVGFDRLVIQLASTRMQIAELKRSRAVLFDKIKNAYDAGMRSVGGGEYQLRMTKSAEPTTYLAVSSERVKRANEAAWERAKIDKQFISVRPPSGVLLSPNTEIAADIAIDAAARLARAAWNDTGELVKAYKEHPAWAVLKSLRDIESETIEQLDKIGADNGWDGYAMTFADGWTVGLRRRQFSSERLEEIAPDVFDQLATPKIRQFHGHVYVAKRGESSDNESHDLDDDGADSGAE
jgi:hypothetical protein